MEKSTTWIETSQHRKRAMDDDITASQRVRLSDILFRMEVRYLANTDKRAKQ